MRDDCDAYDAQIYRACMCCVVLMITLFLVMLFCDGVAKRGSHGVVGFKITMLSLPVITVAIVLKSLCSYEVRLSMAARRVRYIFAGYVVTCFEIGVLIFAIPLTAVSAAEMMFVCLISKLWWFTLLFVMAVVFYTSNALLIHQ